MLKKPGKKLNLLPELLLLLITLKIFLLQVPEDSVKDHQLNLPLSQKLHAVQVTDGPQEHLQIKIQNNLKNQEY